MLSRLSTIAVIGAGLATQVWGATLPEKTVKELQQRLAQTGYLQGEKPSGTWDQKTSQAVKLFQQDYGLPASGKADPKTLAALNIGEPGQGT